MDQYNDAVQHAGTAFVDPVLKSGKVSTNGLGLPIALGGSFALTYRVTTSGRKFAVRCFHKAAKDLEVRYPRISQTLNATDNQYFVGFEYQTQGVLVNGLKYPIVKMDWVEGDTLGPDHRRDAPQEPVWTSVCLYQFRPLEGTNYKDQHLVRRPKENADAVQHKYHRRMGQRYRVS
jgi:hypothetical protein